MKDGKPDQRQTWIALEKFRNARAFGYGGCILTMVVAMGALLRLISAF